MNAYVVDELWKVHVTRPGGAPENRGLQRRTTSDAVAAELREAIVRGDFADGDELNQVELAKEFGVSRVPIREALRQLTAEGLIITEPHMRAAVVGHTLDRVLEILDLRILVECYLVSRCGERMTAADFDQMQAMAGRMRKAGDHDEWLAQNTAFHDALYDFADAPVARDLAHQLAIRVQRYARMARSGSVSRSADANREHEEILAALEQGQIERAQLAVRHHIEGTAIQVRRIFESGQPAVSD